MYGGLILIPQNYGGHATKVARKEFMKRAFCNYYQLLLVLSFNAKVYAKDTTDYVYGTGDIIDFCI